MTDPGRGFRARVPHGDNTAARRKRSHAWRRRALIGAALLLLAPAIAAASSSPELPDWVMQAASAPGSWGDSRAVFLLEDTLLTVQPDGRAVERYRAVVKILRSKGRRDAAPAVFFSRDAKLIAFHVWSIGPDGHRYAMKDSEYIEQGIDVQGILYQDERIRMASPPGADPGGVVAWEFTKELPPYFSEDTWDFQHEVPVVHSVYETDLPPGWHEYAAWFRHPPAAPVVMTPGDFRWEQTKIQGIDLSDVPLAPPWRSLAGRMTLHFSRDPVPEGDALWTEIGDWYYNLAAPRSEGGADLAAMARSIVPDGDFMARLTGIADFMQQQIRYVAIEIGIGGWQPHPAEDVFHSRYGDCKDKATLLIALLDAVGIRATWVVVDTERGFIDPGTPSIAGNHAIAAIEIPAGYENSRLQAVVTTRTGKRYLIFDPTNEYVPVGELPEYLQGGYGLLSAGTDSQVIQMPVLEPEADTVERRASFQLDPDGTLKGEVTVLDSGASAWRLRDRLAMASDKQQRQELEQLLQHDLSTFTLGAEKAENIRDLQKPLELEYSVTAPQYAKSAGDLLLVRPRVLGRVSEGLDDKPRTVPVSFRALRTWRDNFDVKIPAGYSVDEVPDPVNVDAGFATYHSEVKAQGDTIHYQREYVLKKLSVAPGDYPALRRLEARITSDEDSTAVLKKQ